MLNFVKNSVNLKHGFSLVEMLMALLVASLLMAALAPVMTRRMHDSMTISVEGEIPGKTTKHHEITYQDCLDKGGKEIQEKDKDGNILSEYCEGTFDIPAGYNGDMNVTVIGAGGGGGTASTTGYVEYTTAGSTNTFTVPTLINKLEATLISGGAGGGAGGQVLVDTNYTTGGQFNWTIPAVLKDKFALITGCGGGGGGGGSSYTAGGGGGSGGYVVNRAVAIPNTNKLIIQIGGGGGAGGGDNLKGNNGRTWDGAAGGSGINVQAIGSVSSGHGGVSPSDTGGTGGTGGDHGSANGASGADVITNILISGGSGGYGAGKGGDSPAAITGNVQRSGGGGGGGGSFHGGGGGGAGGGSGGGGGGATVLYLTVERDGSSQLFRASGGGGGGGGTGHESSAHNQGGGGGGGGGNGGGNGGNGGGIDANGNTSFTLQGSPGMGGAGGNPGSGSTGGQISTIFGNSFCSGGNGAIGNHNATGFAIGNDGKDGAMKISYLSYGAGGSGGGAASIVPVRSVSVTPNETINLSIGVGAKGGTAGYIDKNGTIVAATAGETPAPGRMVTSISDSLNNILLQAVGSIEWCPKPGHPSGQIGSWGISIKHGHSGAVYNGITYGTGGPGSAHWVELNGFTSTGGHTANNGTTLGSNVFSNGSTGGDGGIATTPWFTCTPGKGGTLDNPKGGDAQGYGCGGGGGYGLSNGGNGSGGYARISWNKYWDAADSVYKYAKTGAAGGGASGNIMTYKVTGLQSGTRIKIRIGKGGTGAFVNNSNNTVVNARKGGDTVFAYDIPSKKVSAGGGNAGLNPSINTDTKTIINGTGGTVSTLCQAPNNKDYANIKCSDNLKINCCTKGLPGNGGLDNDNGAIGGKGADLAQSSLINKGGAGGITGSNAKGNNAYDKGIGSGGGGAGILDIGTPTISTHNPNTGGNGSNGKILLEWWE